MTHLNILDLVFLIIISLSVLVGIIKGFIRELFSLFFLVAAGILAFLFYSDAGAFYIKYLGNKELAHFAGFITVFVIVLIVGAVVTYFIKKILTVGPLKTVDRILGAVFGLLRGILIAGIIVFALIIFPINENLITQSTLSPYVAGTVEIFLALLPGHVKEKLNFFNEKTRQNKNHDRQKDSRISKTV